MPPSLSPAYIICIADLLCGTASLRVVVPGPQEPNSGSYRVFLLYLLGRMQGPPGNPVTVPVVERCNQEVRTGSGCWVGGCNAR